MNPRTKNRPSPRTALLTAVVLMLGLAGLLGSAPNGQSVGLLLTIAGAGGLGWWLWQFVQWSQAKRAQEAEVRRRAALQSARREREAQERARRQAERETQENAAARLRDIREAERRVEAERAEAEALLRLERNQKSEAEAERLRSLDDTRFAAEIYSLFTSRGYHVERASDGSPVELLLSRPETHSLAVARCLPVHRMATVSDGNALEAWRMEAGADKAYLISARGFAPDLVRLAKNRPLVLVEPILLAAWKQQARIEKDKTI